MYKVVWDQSQEDQYDIITMVQVRNDEDLS